LDRARVLNVSRLSEPGSEPILCYVTGRRLLGGAGARDVRDALLHSIESTALSGVDWIQIREKDLSGRECALLARDALKCAAKASNSNTTRTRILINDRSDVALAERTGGVHLGENSLPVQEVRRFVVSHGTQEDFLIGVSCHSLEVAKSAATSGADYIFFGPVFATPSKAAYGAPQGLERLKEVCRAVSIPVIAIGGITLANGAACLSAGARGLAAIRLFQDAPDIRSCVQGLKQFRA
jgi:thiamine-phosphate pyrophosphorylase